MSEKVAKAARKADALVGFKIDIRNYQVPDPAKPGEMGTIDVKDNLATMLFHAELKLAPEEMFKAKDLADKIRASGDSVLLDKIEMERIKRSYVLLKGLPERFIEFLSRVRDAEEVSLKEDNTEEDNTKEDAPA